MRKDSNLLLAKQLKIMDKNLKKKNQRQIMLDGLMTICKLENGLKIADFMCCEDVEVEEFSGTFKVDGKHDGNVYMTEKPKRVKNRPIFREDNSSFSLGRDKKYYFYFTLEEDQLRLLPERLVRQATAIAQKVLRELILGE